MQIEILGWESSFTPPDKDGDAYVRGKVTFEVRGLETAHLVVARHLVTDADGTPFLFDEQEEDDELDDGNTCQVEVTSFSKQDLEGASGSLLIELYNIEHREVATSRLAPSGQRTGAQTSIALDQGLTLLGWSLSTSPADDEGQVTVEMLMVVRNDSKTAIPKVEARASLRKRNGDELDYCRDSIEGLQPGQIRKLGGSAWFQERWLSKDISALLTLRQHRPLAHAQTPKTELELRAS